jgi:SAM-dependent methyltransferase
VSNSVDAADARTRLNLGCGRDIREGYLNLDSAPLAGVDVVHDIEQLPLPFEDASFEEVLCNDVLEHTDYIPVVADLHRILRPAGRLVVHAPHFTSRNVYLDPTHKAAFSIDTFRFFLRNGLFDREYYFDFHFSRVENSRIVFAKDRVLFWNYVVEPIVNVSPKLQRLYEETFLARLFPALAVEVTLVK